jgi:hypothetical protein
VRTDGAVKDGINLRTVYVVQSFNVYDEKPPHGMQQDWCSVKWNPWRLKDFIAMSDLLCYIYDISAIQYMC